VIAIATAPQSRSSSDRIRSYDLGRSGQFETKKWTLECAVTGFRHKTADGKYQVTGVQCAGTEKEIVVNSGDFVFFENGSMTDASSLGSMANAPTALTKADSGDWNLWEKLAKEQPDFGNPAVFNSAIAQSNWESFTVTLADPAFFERVTEFSKNQPGTDGLVTFKRFSLAHVDRSRLSTALPQATCRMRYVTSMFMLRSRADALCPFRRVRQISRSPANSSKFQMMSSLPLSTLCARPRLPYIKLLGINLQVPPLSRTTSQCECSWMPQ